MEPNGFWQQIRSWLAPWGEINRHPGPFLYWIIVVLVLGGIGLSIPLLRPGGASWSDLIRGGSVGGFCAVLLADAIAFNLLPSQLKQLVLIRAQWGRILASLFAFVLVLYQATIIAGLKAGVGLGAAAQHQVSQGSSGAAEGGPLLAQNITSILVLFTVAYLQSFRLGELDEGVAEYSKKQEDEVHALGSKAGKKQKTGRGEAL